MVRLVQVVAVAHQEDLAVVLQEVIQVARQEVHQEVLAVVEDLLAEEVLEDFKQIKTIELNRLFFVIQ